MGAGRRAQVRTGALVWRWESGLRCSCRDNAGKWTTRPTRSDKNCLRPQHAKRGGTAAAKTVDATTLYELGPTPAPAVVS